MSDIFRRSFLSAAAAENTQLHEALDKSLQEEAKAQASLQSMKRLLPFLDPKHLDKVCVG